MRKKIFSVETNRERGVNVEQKKYKDLQYYVLRGSIYIDGAKDTLTPTMQNSMTEDLYQQIKSIGDIEKKELSLARESTERIISGGEKLVTNMRQAWLADRLDEAIEYNKKIKTKRRREEEEERRREEEERRREKENIKRVQEKFVGGAYIAPKEFIALCEMHDVKIPLRTKGYILDKVCEVYKGGYTRSTKHTSKATLNAIKKLSRGLCH